MAAEPAWPKSWLPLRPAATIAPTPRSIAMIDLGVADDGRSFLRVGRGAGADERGRGRNGNETRRWRRSPRPDRSLGSGHVRLASHHFPRNLVVRRRTVNAIAIRSDCGTFSTQIVPANAATAGRGLHAAAR